MAIKKKWLEQYIYIYICSLDKDIVGRQPLKNLKMNQSSPATPDEHVFRPSDGVSKTNTKLKKNSIFI